MIYGSLNIEPQLEKALLQELLDMVQVEDANGKVHLIAQIDFRNAKYIPSKRYYIRKNELVVRGSYPNMNMGNPKTLEDFMRWAMQYPARNRMLYVLGHGTGWISVEGPGSITDGLRSMATTRSNVANQIDTSLLRTPESFYPSSLYPSKAQPKTRSYAYDHTQKDSINLEESTQVFDRVLGNQKIDVLAFRSCLMNQIETAYQFSKHFDYLVASQTSQYGVAQGILTAIMGINNIGFDTTFLRQVRDNHSVTPEQMTRNMFTSIKNTNLKIIQNVDNLELSVQALDLRALRRAVPSIKELGYSIRRNLENSRTRREMIDLLSAARSHTEKFGGIFEGVYTKDSGDYEYEYIDLAMFMRNMAAGGSNNLDMFAIRDHAQRTQAMLTRAELAKFASGHNFEGVQGGGVTSIFMFPNNNERLVNAYNRLMADKYARLDFNRDTQWNEVLNQYYSQVIPLSTAFNNSGAGQNSNSEAALGVYAEIETNQENPTAFVDVRSANLRKGPGTNFDVITTVHRHSKVEIVEDAGNNWFKVNVLIGEAKGVSGYISGSLLSDN
jgi:uncharacterized protein YgiM (DUF1202 family)